MSKIQYNFCLILSKIKALDEFGGEIDAVRPCNRVRLQRELFKGIDVCKLLHDGAMVRLDDVFKISDKTASVVEFDGYLVVANIFRVSHMKHNLDQWINFLVFSGTCQRIPIV